MSRLDGLVGGEEGEREEYFLFANSFFPWGKWDGNFLIIFFEKEARWEIPTGKISGRVQRIFLVCFGRRQNSVPVSSSDDSWIGDPYPQSHPARIASQASAIRATELILGDP